MSRSGYDEGGDDNWSLIKYRGQVASAIRGKRGQAFLRELIAALDAVPEKKLIAHELRLDGQVCALGSVGARRGIELERLDPEDPETLANVFGIATQLVREIEYVNDEYLLSYTHDNPQKRWQRVRDWATRNLKDAVQP